MLMSFLVYVWCSTVAWRMRVERQQDGDILWMALGFVELILHLYYVLVSVGLFSQFREISTQHSTFPGFWTATPSQATWLHEPTAYLPDLWDWTFIVRHLEWCPVRDRCLGSGHVSTRLTVQSWRLPFMSIPHNCHWSWSLAVTWHQWRAVNASHALNMSTVQSQE